MVGRLKHGGLQVSSPTQFTRPGLQGCSPSLALHFNTKNLLHATGNAYPVNLIAACIFPVIDKMGDHLDEEPTFEPFQGTEEDWWLQSKFAEIEAPNRNVMLVCLRSLGCRRGWIWGREARLPIAPAPNSPRIRSNDRPACKLDTVCKLRNLFPCARHIRCQENVCTFRGGRRLLRGV